jgi:hypothetical protein
VAPDRGRRAHEHGSVSLGRLLDRHHGVGTRWQRRAGHDPRSSAGADLDVAGVPCTDLADQRELDRMVL